MNRFKTPSRLAGATVAGLVAVLLAVPALAQVASAPAGNPLPPGVGRPEPWQMNFQGSVTNIMDFSRTFGDYLHVIMALICLFVLALLIVVAVRFNERAHPTPSRTTHNSLLEVAWTIVPVLILVAIAIPSFRLLKLQLDLPKPDITVKVVGKQWLWTWEYPADQGGGFSFDQNMIDDDARQKAFAAGKPITEPRLLAVDNEAVLPIGKVIRLQVTGADVIHSWTITSIGNRLDAIPGRLNELWFKGDRLGIFYGQCSRICGQNHPYMPTAIRFVTPEDYAVWLAAAKAKYASAGDAPVRLAGRAAEQPR